MKLDDFFLEHGVKNINVDAPNDIMRNILVEFIDGNKFEVYCNVDDMGDELVYNIPKHSKLGQRRKKIKIINNI